MSLEYTALLSISFRQLVNRNNFGRLTSVGRLFLCNLFHPTSIVRIHLFHTFVAQ